MRRNMSIDWETSGQYTTHLLTSEAERLIEQHNTSNPLFMYVAQLAVHAGNYEDPLQAPQSTLDMFNHIEDEGKRKYTG